mmetsp:Transcript_2618/g.5438  ORF Transcript_2618/g.5438 Transcript_2618/m.5438 type:complete len:475 (-) Transcript_2618:182-1606(-)
MGGRSGGTFVDDGSDSDLVASCVGSARDEFGGTSRRVGVERGTGRRSDGAGARAHRDPCLVFRNLTGSAKRTKSRKFRGAFVEQVAHRDFLSAGVFRARDVFVGTSHGIRIEGGRGRGSQTSVAPSHFRPRQRSGHGSGSEGRFLAVGGVVRSASIHLRFLRHLVAPAVVPARSIDLGTSPQKLLRRSRRTRRVRRAPLAPSQRHPPQFPVLAPRLVQRNAAKGAVRVLLASINVPLLRRRLVPRSVRRALRKERRTPPRGVRLVPRRRRGGGQTPPTGSHHLPGRGPVLPHAGGVFRRGRAPIPGGGSVEAPTSVDESFVGDQVSSPVGGDVKRVGRGTSGVDVAVGREGGRKGGSEGGSVGDGGGIDGGIAVSQRRPGDAGEGAGIAGGGVGRAGAVGGPFRVASVVGGVDGDEGGGGVDFVGGKGGMAARDGGVGGVGGGWRGEGEDRRHGEGRAVPHDDFARVCGWFLVS